MLYESVLETDGDKAYNYVWDQSSKQELHLTDCIFQDKDFITFVAVFPNGFQAEISVVNDKDDTVIISKLYDVKSNEVAQEETDRIFGIHKYKVGEDQYVLEIATLQPIELPE